MVLDQFCSGNSEQVEQLGIPWFYSTKEVIFSVAQPISSLEYIHIQCYCIRAPDMVMSVAVQMLIVRNCPLRLAGLPNLHSHGTSTSVTFIMAR